MRRNGDLFNNEYELKRKKLIFFFAVFLAIFPISIVFADHNACYIKAEDAKVWVRVFDVDEDGNIKSDYSSLFYRRKTLWKGILEKGQTHRIESSNGEISYEYKASSDDRSYGANLASCSHGEIIRVR
jgi:hypothetical protein